MWDGCVLGLSLVLLCACGDDAAGADAAAPRVDAAGRDAARPDSGAFDARVDRDAGERAQGDRYVATDGVDAGDCSSDPCRTFEYAGSQMTGGETLVVRDGVYPDAIETDTFPRGAAGAFTRIVAERRGGTTAGGLSLHDNGDFFLEIDGLRFVGPQTKGVAGGNVRLLGVSFVGGPPEGNAVGFGVGTNDFYPGAWDVLCEDCLFYGEGGRYAAMAYRATRVTFRRIVARKDGGWGIGSSGATGFEPEGVVMFYESSETLCEQCVVLDSVKLSHESAEALGAIIHNSHDAMYSTNVALVGCLAIDNAYSGLTFEGNGRVNGARVTDTVTAGNAGNGVTFNLNDGGDATLTRVTAARNDGDGIADYSSVDVTLTDCRASGNTAEPLRGVSGDASGAGAGAIDLSGFDGDRIRRELCEGETRGFCGSALPFAEYVTGRLAP